MRDQIISFTEKRDLKNIFFVIRDTHVLRDTWRARVSKQNLNIRDSWCVNFSAREPWQRPPLYDPLNNVISLVENQKLLSPAQKLFVKKNVIAENFRCNCGKCLKKGKRGEKQKKRKRRKNAREREWRRIASARFLFKYGASPGGGLCPAMLGCCLPFSNNLCCLPFLHGYPTEIWPSLFRRPATLAKYNVWWFFFF